MAMIPGLPTAWKRALWWTVAGISIAGVLVVGAWVVDQKVIHEGMVMRNVTLDGEAVGGLGPADLDARLAAIAEDVADDVLTVDLPERVITATNATAGVTADVTATRSALMEQGRSGNLVEQFEAWAQSFLEPVALELAYTYDQGTLDGWVGDLPDAHLSDPVEPTFTGASGSIEVQPGVDGAYLDAETVAVAAAEAFTTQSSPFTVAVDWTPIPPQVTPEAVEEAVAEAETLADSNLTVSVGEHVSRIGPKTVRRWIVSEQDGATLVPVFDQPKVHRQLERILAEFADEGEDPTFAIVDGEVDVEYGTPPTRCCAPGVADLVFEAISSGRQRTLALPLVEVEDARTQAAKLGITEMVSEFTTNHNCCESRVENIHRIADIVRGVVIHPGETFSINDFVGERTTEKGFVPAGTIQFGRFEDAVGGGISQFATTMFNAAFFAGLEFEEYQSHSLYIDRYPYGREATLSYPHPDLVVTNDTPYGVLLWPTYTGSSITMQMWSTRYWDVEQTGQSSYPAGQCTQVETFRSRTNPDGVTENDEVFALYRPGEGLDCNGNPTPEVG
jgi:vancomycin resistance protein YoaR